MIRLAFYPCLLNLSGSIVRWHLHGRDPLRRVRLPRSEATPQRRMPNDLHPRPPASAHKQVGRGTARPYPMGSDGRVSPHSILFRQALV